MLTLINPMHQQIFRGRRSGCHWLVRCPTSRTAAVGKALCGLDVSSVQDKECRLLHQARRADCRRVRAIKASGRRVRATNYRIEASARCSVTACIDNNCSVTAVCTSTLLDRCLNRVLFILSGYTCCKTDLTISSGIRSEDGHLMVL